MNIKEHITKAFDLISVIPVTGDNVDIMCAARSELRAAYKLTESEGKNGRQDNKRAEKGDTP